MLKPAFHGSAHALHQDSAYWPIDPPALVTVSIALTEATADNGCFKIIPHSHEWCLQDWGRILLRQNESLTEREDIDLDTQIDVPLAAGSALFFHSLLVHGSGPNSSPNARNTALYAYFSPHVRYCPKTGPAERSFPVVSGIGGCEEHILVASV
jgi:ectoine hydroxylase-related dioxygenase (phytanoyl-CoA dioxygenase family)